MNIGKKRNLGIDILCCIGVMLLLGLQYLDAVGFSIAKASWSDAVPALVWELAMSGTAVLAGCVGYILGTKDLTSSHYLVFIRFLYIYIPCAAVSLWMRVTMFNDVLTDTDAITAVLTFMPTQTGGTVGMYFFLLLGAPLLNWFFRGLKYRPVRFTVIQLMLVFAGLQPMLLVDGKPWLPGWVRLLYPAAVYLGGAYLCEYRKHLKRLPLAIVLVLLVSGTTAAVLSTGGDAPWVKDAAALPYLMTGLVLLALCHSRENALSPTHHFFMGAAGGSLVALILGDLMLDAALPAIDERFPKGMPRMAFGLAAVPVVFILCAVLGLLMQLPLFYLRLYLHPEILDPQEEEEKKPNRRRHADVIVPERTHTEASRRRRSHDSRHSIRVSVSDPEVALHLTQPAMEKPQGVVETHLPDLPDVPQDYPEPDPSAEDEGEVKVYVPKHAAAPGQHSTFSAASRAIEEAERAEHHSAVTVDQILLETRRHRTRADTVNDLLRSLESEDDK